MNQCKIARRRREQALMDAIRGVQKDAQKLRLSPERLAKAQKEWAEIYAAEDKRK